MRGRGRAGEAGSSGYVYGQGQGGHPWHKHRWRRDAECPDAEKYEANNNKKSKQLAAFWDPFAIKKKAYETQCALGSVNAVALYEGDTMAQLTIHKCRWCTSLSSNPP